MRRSNGSSPTSLGRTPPGRPAVWAIDDAHAPLYWFPRECPRVTAWPRVSAEVDGFQSAFRTAALRVHAVELGWIDRIRTTQLFRYSFDARQFDPWPKASGYWTSADSVVPIEVEPMGDLFDAHVHAAIELRAVAVALAAPRCRPVRRMGLQHRSDAQRGAATVNLHSPWRRSTRAMAHSRHSDIRRVRRSRLSQLAGVP